MNRREGRGGTFPWWVVWLAAAAVGTFLVWYEVLSPILDVV